VRKFRTQTEVQYEQKEVDEVRYRTRPVTKMVTKTVPVYNIIPKPPEPPRKEVVEAPRALEEKAVPTTTSSRNPGPSTHIPASMAGDGRISKGGYFVPLDSVRNDRLGTDYAPDTRIPADFIPVSKEEERRLRQAENQAGLKYIGRSDAYNQLQNSADAGYLTRRETAPYDIDLSVPLELGKESVERTAHATDRDNEVQASTEDASRSEAVSDGTAYSGQISEPGRKLKGSNACDNRNGKTLDMKTGLE